MCEEKGKERHRKRFLWKPENPPEDDITKFIERRH
jgi:hypothetical protein